MSRFPATLKLFKVYNPATGEVHSTAANKELAKRMRNTLNKALKDDNKAEVWRVGRGPDHRKGESS